MRIGKVGVWIVVWKLWTDERICGVLTPEMTGSPEWQGWLGRFRLIVDWSGHGGPQAS